MSVAFFIEHIGHCTKFTNKSECSVMVSWKPVKPKRKIIDVLIIPKGTFLIENSHIKIEDIYISFIDVEKDS